MVGPHRALKLTPVDPESDQGQTCSEAPMAKPHRKIKKANHGARPANAKARKRKRSHIKT